MKIHIQRFLVCAVIVVFVCASSACADWLEKPLREYEDGKLYQTKGLSVIVLRGCWYEMGRQYGTLLRTEMRSLHTLMLLGLSAHNLDQGRLEAGFAVMESQLRLYPQRIREMHRGMMEGSGMTFREIATLEHYLAAQFAVRGGLFCSAISVWGDFSVNGEMIVGRNMELPKHYVIGCPFFTIAIFHPVDGSVPTATIGYVGQVSTSTMLNATGLVAFFNTPANLLPVQQVHLDRVTITISLLLFGLDCSDMRQFDTAIQTQRFNFAQICTVADAEQTWTYEVGTSRVVRREQDESGLNTVTNWATDPIWEEYLKNVPPNPQQELDLRQKHLQELGRRYKGEIDVDKMKQILDIEVREGGVTLPLSGHFEDFTLYQFVFMPATRQLSVRQPAYRQDWIDIDLDKFFSTK